MEIAEIVDASPKIKHDDVISFILTDSRSLSFPETSLFFAIKTKTNDGHKYIPDLYKLGVRNFVVTKYILDFKDTDDANFLYVEDSLEALQKLTAHHRRRFIYPVIGITGSNGKTIVKELLYQILRKEYNIVRSPRSFNSQIGVPLSVWEMNEHNTLGIFEAGISKPNEMDNLRYIINPTIGVIVNIGEAHQENFKSGKEKCIEKLSLFVDAGIIIYNLDNELISASLDAACLSFKAIGWSLKDTEAFLFVNSIVKKDGFTIVVCTTMGITHSYVIPFTDDAFIEDTIAAMTVAFYLSPSNIVDKDGTIASLEPVAMRMEIKEGINGCQLINDTYNSDLNALNIALDFLLSRQTDKKMINTVILSDILQSGLPYYILYEKVGKILKNKKIDKLIGIGPEIYRNSARFSNIDAHFYTSTEDFIKSFRPDMFGNENILLKGSRSFHFEHITELLEKKVHETVLEVSLDAVVHNYNYYRSRIRPQTKMICMVKAFGYGMGSYELAKTLQDHRCDYLAVAIADEGEDLRKKGVSMPVMVMNPEISCFNTLFDYFLEPEIYSFRLLNELIKYASRHGITSYPVHIKIDTGMHRLGFNPDELPQLCDILKKQNSLIVRSVFSHPAGSDDAQFDDFTRSQADTFTRAANCLEDKLGYRMLKHILNSAGIDRFPEYQFDMVRLGISLYGVSASAGVPDLENVCSLKTIILQIRHVKSGDSIGYGRKTFLSRDSEIAVIPIGYADGFDRHLSNGTGEVIIRGQRCRIAGNVCMDTCMVDVTGIGAVEGDEVIIFNNELTVGEIAGKLSTIPYEVLTSISSRVKRVYYRE
jgi:alanine racemase